MQVLKDLDAPRNDGDCGGQAPALRVSRPPPFTVGRGPVPRHASRYGKTSLRSVEPKTPPLDDGQRGGQAPALRKNGS